MGPVAAASALGALVRHATHIEELVVASCKLDVRKLRATAQDASLDLSGRKGLVVGIANDRSLAWPAALHFRQAGAELAIRRRAMHMSHRTR